MSRKSTADRTRRSGSRERYYTDQLICSLNSGHREPAPKIHSGGYSEPVGRCPRTFWLLADATVDPFAEQVGVAEVAGVLLDHVEYHLAQRDGSAVLHGAANGEVG